MTSKFTEMIDTSVAPAYSSRNVSLEDILREMGQRSNSQSSAYSSGNTSPTSSEQSLASSPPAASAASAAAKRLRRITLGKKP